MVQLRNIIDRRNIGKGKNIKHHVNAIEDFLELVIRCHATLHYFGMGSVTDVPHSNGFPTVVPVGVRRKTLLDAMRKIADTYIVPRATCLPDASCSNPPAEEEMTTNPHAIRVAEEHQYFYAPPTSHRKLPETVRKLAPQPQASQAVKKISPDGVHNYASAVLNDGLLLLEFKDAVREGDGERILRVWKVLLMYFHHAKHKNYKLEAFHLLSMVNICAPRISAQMKWSRVVNIRGGSGHNISVDLHMEHLNRAVKDYVANLGANSGEKPIIQCAKSLNGIMVACQQFDVENNISPQSIKHTRQSNAKYFDSILNKLVSSSSVFDYIPGRSHPTFKGIQPSIAQCINSKKLLTWLKKQKVRLQREIILAQAYGHNF